MAFVKSEKLRADLPEKFASQSPFGKGYVILDSPAKKLYVVSDAQKQVIVIDLNTSGEKLKGIGSPSHGGGAGGAKPEGPKTTLTKTGKFDTVAGYKCENWDVTSDHRQGTLCVAQEGVSWFHIPMTGIPTEHLWMAELLDGKHFPLRFVGYGKDGVTETGRFEVTKIDKRTLPVTEFEYPPAYRVGHRPDVRGHGGMGDAGPAGDASHAERPADDASRHRSTLLSAAPWSPKHKSGIRARHAGAHRPLPPAQEGPSWPRPPAVPQRSRQTDLR
jgi:hypothetical protein